MKAPSYLDADGEMSGLDLHQSNNTGARLSRGRHYWEIDFWLVCGKGGGLGVWAKLSPSAKAIYPVLQILSNGALTGTRQHTLAAMAGISEPSVRKGATELDANGLTSRKKLKIGRKKYRYQTRLMPVAGVEHESSSLDNAVITRNIWRELSPSAKALYIAVLAFASPGATLVREQAWMKDQALRQMVFGDLERDLFRPTGFDWDKFMGLMRDAEMKQRFRRHLVMVTPRVRRMKYRGLVTLAKHAGIDVKSAKRAIIELESRRLCLFFPRCEGHSCSHVMVPLPRRLHFQKKTPPALKPCAVIAEQSRSPRDDEEVSVSPYPVRREGLQSKMDVDDSAVDRS